MFGFFVPKGILRGRGRVVVVVFVVVSLSTALLPLVDAWIFVVEGG